MPSVVLPSPLLARTDGVGRVEVAASTAGEALRELERRQPALRGWVLDERGRLRQHVSLFVNDESAGLERPLGEGDELYVVHAISGGAPEPEAAGADDSGCELLVCTRKGLIVLRGPRGGSLQVAGRHFSGQTVDFALRDRRSGRYLAAATHGQFGPHLFWTTDLEADWREADGPAFPEDAEASVSRIWVLEPGEEEGLLWAGVAPAALFRSTDGGKSWELNRALWDDPTRPRWEGGLGGLCLHSICPWPGDPERLSVAISAAGVWHTDDGGASWRRRVEGLVPGYLPEEARASTLQHCVHRLERSPVEPETLYLQFHGGIYRSDDAGESWTDISTGRELPAVFGFPIVAHPRDADRAWVIPLVADVDRVTPEGRLRVYETADRGRSWTARTRGLPQQDAFATVLRQAFCQDGHDPLGLFFGTEGGEVYGSFDGGESWSALAAHLPPVVAIRAAA